MDARVVGNQPARRRNELRKTAIAGLTIRETGRDSPPRPREGERDVGSGKAWQRRRPGARTGARSGDRCRRRRRRRRRRAARARAGAGARRRRGRRRVRRADAHPGRGPGRDAACGLGALHRRRRAAGAGLKLVHRAGLPQLADGAGEPGHRLPKVWAHVGLHGAGAEREGRAAPPPRGAAAVWRLKSCAGVAAARAQGRRTRLPPRPLACNPARPTHPPPDPSTTPNPRSWGRRRATWGHAARP
jgi:hypothetical protein